MVGRSGEFGTVTVGKRADLVLVDGDPRADIANTQKIVAVMARGTLRERRELDAWREDVAAVQSGKRSRFADAPPPAAGEQVVHVDYVTLGGKVVGEERIVIAADGGRISSRMQYMWGGSGGTIEADKLTLDGDGAKITVTRDRGMARVRGRVARRAVAQDVPIPDDALLRNDLVASDVLLARRLRDVPVAGKLELKVATLSVEGAKVKLEVQPVAVERKDAHTYAVRVGETKGELVVDDAGGVVSGRWGDNVWRLRPPR
jgi:hypothetical protein